MRGRFAPSPTGDLHLGNARTALLAWLHARAAGGEFVLRVEDLDFGRVRPGLMESQLEDLRWLGLDWNEGPDVGGQFGPYLQSQRRDRYEAALERLENKGLIYQCVCSRRDIAAAATAPNAGDEEGPPYPGTCRKPESTGRIETDRRSGSALRFIASPRAVFVRDAVHGERRFHPEAETGDFVVRRKDGVAAYQLSVVVDDAAMGITHVVRGADLLSSTARQILLYEALGLEPPVWIHVPLLLGPDGARLAKRHGSVSLRDLRGGGVNPAHVVGWLAGTCGLAREGEKIAPEQLISRFAIEAIPKAPFIVESLPWSV